LPIVAEPQPDLLGNPVGRYLSESAIEMGAVKVDEHEPLVEA
jgi:hypothetical protein